MVDDSPGFGSPVTVTLTKSGRFGNQIIATPSSALSAGTRYYVKANSGGSNDGGHAISTHKNLDLLQLHHRRINGISNRQHWRHKSRRQ